MKTRTHKLSRLALVLLAASPLAAMAAPGASSAYMTDTTQSYVHDQTSEALNSLNGILCYISSMAPAQMVNEGDYIALVDKNVCEPNDGGGQSGSTNTGTDYTSMVVNSSRTDSGSPMIGKVWFDEDSGGGSKSLYAKLSATQAPVLPNDPFGRFRMDFCGQDTLGNCMDSGYINSTDSGLSFFSQYTGDWGGSGAVTQTRQLTLVNATSTSGSGRIAETAVVVSSGLPPVGWTAANFRFAYNADYFRRTDETNDTCFSRDPADAKSSVWNYGVYDSGNGARIERNSGFPIEYTDTSSNTMNGYIGYWGLNAPTPVNTALPVYKVTYGSGAPTKTAYTLMQTGGKLLMYTTVVKTLADLDKVKFQFWPQQTAGVVTNTSGYEAYWDETGQTFMVSGQQDSVTYNIVPQTPVALSIADMKLASPWGLYGWSNMLGGQFSISQSAMITLGSATTVTTHVQDVVYPSDFTTGMICISNCPTLADINASNADVNGTIQPYTAVSVGWTAYQPPGVAWTTYTFNTTTGNLRDGANADVVNSATSGRNAWGVNSGRMLDDTPTNRDRLNAAVTARNGTPNQYIQSDIDAVIALYPTTPYYEWQTGANNWNQLALLKDGSNQPVRFDPPLNVTWDVPNDVPTYGISANATITLQFGGFGNLWGIPSTCINMTTNGPCTFAVGENQRWTPEFSIPEGQLLTVPYTQGSTASGTQYLVKPLQREVRLGEVNILTCTNAGLTLPLPGSITLPSGSSWIDPSPNTPATSIGPMPTVNASPRVIQGEVMY